ncbi:DedA family protein [Altererythrobacter confluentis]|uniref:DedA family protein n=1 Tax=Allopontixanthobacter confluentis TaxID=1849021 RepID=A0A6L7GF14_9SPHN|nr:DedA family protein [Allopontixanthobacter confluentis]MXP14075.1 DedA family protein [Allopontixanthobacter confluentis]
MTEFIINAVEQGSYIGILLLMALENIFPPVPSEVIMGLGGVLVGQGKMGFWPLLFAGTVGSTLGNYVWYWVGDKWGYERLRPFIDRFGRWLTMEWHDIERVTEFFQKHGQWAVFFARFLPVFRTMISLPAGLAHMSLRRFIAFTFVGSAIWNVFLIFAGTLLHTYLDGAQNMLGWIVAGFVGVGLAAYVWRLVTWKPRAQR